QVSLPGLSYEPNLVVHMTGRASGAEVAYGRTCAFDLVEGQPLPQPHLYLSRTVKWAAVASAPIAPRLGGAGFTAADGSALSVAVTQSDGKVAVIGGRDVNGALVATVLEIRSDAGAIALREVRADLATRREDATATRLGDAVGAPILVVGGVDGTGHVVATAE